MNKPRAAIICVDDEEIILSSLEKQLKRNLGNNYDIELATNGWEALEICNELTKQGIIIALVISDQIMPRMSGDEFLIKLHALYPKTLKILLTGQAEAHSVGNIVNAAALYRYIAKPWDETDLILTVREALRRYGQEQQLARQNILLQQTNEKLAKSLNLLLSTFEAANDGIVVLDDRGGVVIFNQKFIALWQINPLFIDQDSNQILGLIDRRLVRPIACDLKTKNNQIGSSSYDLLKLNNGNILESYFQTQQLDGEIVGLIWGFRDVTERERAKAEASRKALHDTLTQLPKRRILTCQLTEAIAKAQKNSHMLAVMFIYLDRFKIVSNTLGHQTGDRLIQQVVQRLKDCVQGENSIARWGNDEFTLLLTKINSQQEVSAIAEKILDVVKSPFIIEGKPIYINTHIGIAVYPHDGSNAETILKNADAALSQAQLFGSNKYQYYNLDLNSQAHQLLTIENLLHSALQREQFILYYQPIVNVVTGKIAKMEALLRWKNPQLGFIEPQVFIPLAENNGSIIPIGEWVLQTACAQNKAWQDMGLSPIQMSVNLSMRQFQQPNLISMVINTLEQTKLSPSSLELEITESVTMQDTELTKNILRQLHEIGITLAMDDFGTGYSSLSYLKHFPLRTLKIDRSFFQDLNYSASQDLAIVNTVITLGRGLNMNVVAEGVETTELKDLLTNLGCEYIQGYLFSKPLPAEEATELLKSNSLINQ